MKKIVPIIMLLIVGTLGTQYDTGTMTIDNIPGHQLYTTNVKFESVFNEVPQVVLSIQHVEADQIIELYSRAAEITQQGFLLQIISSSQLSNMKVNYMALNDNQFEIICQNFQTKNGLIKIPLHKSSSVGIFVTGFSVKKDVDFQLKWSLEENQAVFETKQSSLGLCLIAGDEKTINQKTLITTTSDGIKLDFAVQDIADTLNIAQENPILSFDDIMNKLLVNSASSKVNDNEEYLDIDSISIESLGMNAIVTDESDIQSLEIEFLKPTQEQDQIKQAQIINIEKEHIETVKEVIQENINSEIKLELDEIAADRNTLAQVNQNDEVDQQEVENQYDIVPSTADDLDMDALYKEYTLGSELVDDLAGWTSATVVKKDLIKDNIDIESVDVIGDSVLQDIRVQEQKPQEQQQPQVKLDLPVFDEDRSVQGIDQQLEIKDQSHKPTQQDITKQELIDDYQTFVAEESQKQNQKYEQEHPFVEVQPEGESQTSTDDQEMSENMEDDLLGDSLKGIDFDLFFDDFYNPNQKEEQQNELKNDNNKKDKQEEKVAIKYEEPKSFKQPKDNYDDVMRDLRIPDKIESVQDEQELISQLKNKSIELRKKLKEQYDAVPRLEEAKKQTEYSVHSIEEQYPNLNSDPEVEYQVESKYNDWQMSQKDRIVQISQDLTEEDRKNPRFSLLQMDTKSELDIQKQINDFLGWSDASFVMIAQNLRRR